MIELTRTAPAESRMAFLKAHFDDSPLGFFMANKVGLIEYINRTAAAIIGFGHAEEAEGASLQDVELIMNCGLMESFGSLLNGRTFQKKEHGCTNRQGHFAILNISGSPFRGENGNIEGILGMVQDITDTSKRKAELEEAIFELSIMSQVSEALSSTADLDEVLKVILTGVTANQGLGFNRAFLFLVDEQAACLEGKIAVGPFNPEEAGQIWSRLAQQQKTLKELLDDYSERENASNYSLSSLIAGWKIPLDVDSVFSRAINDGCGLNAGNRDNLSPVSSEILNRLNTENLAVAPIISKGKKLGLIAADNRITRRRITSSEVQLLQTFANHTAVAIERSRLYDNLVEHAAELEQKNRLLAESQEQMIRVEKMSVIGELTSSIAHELRNPLTVIGGFANLILSAGGNEANAEYINIILSETKRAETVLHQVLDFSRASRTKTREIDFNVLVSGTSDLLLSKIKHRHRPPILKLGGQKLAVWGNPDQLQHALLQFMIIAVEEMTDECSIELITHLKEDMVRLTFGFNGGEEARTKVVKTLKQIFGNNTGTQKLSIIVAGETLRYHGGNYGVESSPENLPKLYIELPQYRGGIDEQTAGN
jgi:PAS domain S-box-containing protein